MKLLHIFAVLSAGLLTGPVMANDGPIGAYTARLSARDHFNSKGTRLTTVAAIIRQDRANVHVFGKIDREDESDDFFDDAGNRAKLEKFLASGRMGPGVASAVINREPLIHVVIYPNFIYVTVL